MIISRVSYLVLLVLGSFFSISHQLSGMAIADLLSHDSDDRVVQFSTTNSNGYQQCFFCNEGRDYAPALHKHIKLHHPEHTVTECQFCLRLFKDTSSSLEHLAQEHGDNSYACVYCPQRLNDRDKLIKHIRNDHKKIKTYVCNGCAQSHATEGEVHNHMQNCDKQAYLMFIQSQQYADAFLDTPQEEVSNIVSVADTCTTTTSTLSPVPVDQSSTETDVYFAAETLLQIRNANSTSDCAEQNRFVCSVKDCTKNTLNKELMLKHKITEHKKDISRNELLEISRNLVELIKSKNNAEWVSKQYFCDVEGCSNRYSCKRDLNSHKIAKHGDGFVCDVEGCGKSYSRQQYLNDHKIAEHGNGFVCDVEGCDKSYSSKRVLNNHKKAEHGDGFVCDVEGCGKSYSRQKSLNDHKIAEHGDGFVCDVEGCGKSYARQQYLNDHKIAEHGDGFVCDVEGCGKSYSSKQLLNDHMIAKHGDGFVCDICGKELSAKSSLKRHKKRLHPQANTLQQNLDVSSTNEELVSQWEEVHTEDGHVRYVCHCGKQYKNKGKWFEKHIANCNG